MLMRSGAAGHTAPLRMCSPVQVVQPQEGSKVVACAESRYEFEVFSGTVLGVPKSEAQNAAEGLLRRFFGFGKGACQAVHEMVVRAPDGNARTFRFGTTSADVPAQVPPLPPTGMCSTAEAFSSASSAWAWPPTPPTR